MTALLALLVGPAKNYIVGALAIGAVLVLAFLWLQSHDASLRNEWALKQQAAVDAAVAKERVAGDQAAKAAQDDAAARSAKIEAVRKVIANAPTSEACIDSRAVGDALNGLYDTGPGASAPVRSSDAP